MRALGTFRGTWSSARDKDYNLHVVCLVATPQTSQDEKGHLVVSRQGRGLQTVLMRCGVCSDCIESAC